jgi:hypothetical protein
MNKSFVLATLTASSFGMTQVESDFLGYITKFGKNYSSV